MKKRPRRPSGSISEDKTGSRPENVESVRHRIGRKVWPVDFRDGSHERMMNFHHDNPHHPSVRNFQTQESMDGWSNRHVNVPTLQSARHAAPYATAQHHTHTIIHTLVHPSSSLTRHEARGTTHKKQRGRERGRAQWVRTVVRNGTTGQEETKAKTNQPTHPQAAAVQHPSYTPPRPPPADAYLSDKSYCAAGQLKVNFKRACSVPPPATAATAPPPSPSPSLPPPSPSPPRCLPTNNVNDVDDVPAPSWRTHIPSLIVDYGHAYL
ncbi:hypothetical protein CTAM01_06036 [Colletotrichum tamarilloi]|uniref:Uncharacterized protein n=1 Tax=Colletotrichum tamarilloi TaxID=1209934 RepID=A0ABQ9RCV8_9PEZI|nr:uncharacterized protein CTAM01_06036 [Colletotrichum tamarilloi]KAK1501311.1 hypothetical protein CTAM01_06036 [Colletotrichum tamarilloi]